MKSIIFIALFVTLSEALGNRYNLRGCYKNSGIKYEYKSVVFTVISVVDYTHITTQFIYIYIYIIKLWLLLGIWRCDPYNRCGSCWPGDCFSISNYTLYKVKEYGKVKFIDVLYNLLCLL
uniref:Uncharacterized protein n=1 Tax=Heterorhabditis bacteriophora TaxID=37862 RepID=A0A1I7WYD1_HETBA